MTGDRVEVLRAALDQVEQNARNANDGEVEWIGDDAADHGCTASGRFIESWTPSRVLRLVERDRKLIELLSETDRELNAAVKPAYETEHYGPLVAVAARHRAIRDLVDLAAVFWLGEEPE